MRQKQDISVDDQHWDLLPCFLVFPSLDTGKVQGGPGRPGAWEPGSLGAWNRGVTLHLRTASTGRSGLVSLHPQHSKAMSLPMPLLLWVDGGAAKEPLLALPRGFPDAITSMLIPLGGRNLSQEGVLFCYQRFLPQWGSVLKSQDTWYHLS